MLQIKLPDGSVREAAPGSTPRDIAAEIGPGLAKAALAAEVNGKVVGLDFQFTDDGNGPASNEPVELKLLTKKDADALGVMRHSCAHVMARAVMRLYEGVGLAFGPTIENGFYYDFDLKQPISEDDFPKIEAEMAKIIKEDEPFERLERDREEALAVCRDLNQALKVEHIQEGLAEHAKLSFYRQGEFVDLCRGPHVPSAGAIGAFKLLSVAGAYWKGDESRQQLQRLYGTAWFSKQEMEEYLERVKEAKRRDHRVLGKQHALFEINQLVGPGLILWEPKLAEVRYQLESFIREELRRRGYSPVYTPHIGKLDLYRTSGHYPYYADSQYPPFFMHPFAGPVQELLSVHARGEYAADQLIKKFEEYQQEEIPPRLRPHIDGYEKLKSDDQKLAAINHWLEEQEAYLLKPMNCPHHIQIYEAQQHSYRDLPIRLAEFGTVYRFEQTGELNGMTRVRGFTQDDAHIFCTEDQVAEEFRGCVEMTQFVLDTLGMRDFRVRLGFRTPESEKYVGGADVWQRAESTLEDVCRNMDLPGLEVEPGEAAFYGPKADFVVQDCIGREWQLGTVQLDYNLPSKERFALSYIGADNTSHQPVMIHRAPLGSMERFIGLLIEHFAGAFPLWLAPVQARVMTVSEKSEEYGRKVEAEFRAAGLRVEADYRGEKLGAKIRDAQLQLVPYMLVVGNRDAENGTLALRDRLEGDVGTMPVQQAIDRLQAEIRDRAVRQTFGGGNAGLGDRHKQAEY